MQFSHLEHTRGNAVVALVIVKAESRVGIEGIEAVILQLIGPHLVGEAEATALLSQIQDNAAAKLFKLGEREPKLIAAVASPGAEHIPGQAGRVEPDRNGLCEVRLADDDGDLICCPLHRETR